MKLLPNFTGQKKGKWFVLEKLGSKKSGGVEYLCECECGYKTRIFATRLKNAKGCRYCANKLTNLSIGHKIHNWTIISKPESIVNKKGIFYLCQCNCGFKKHQPASRLLSDLTKQCKSCAVKNKIKPNKNINLSGQQIGDWTILRPTIIKNSDNTRRNGFVCRCKCGKECNQNRNNIIKMGPEACCIKCASQKRGLKQWRGTGYISGHKWSAIINSAKNRNIELTITLQEIWNLFVLQSGKCALSGITLIWAKPGEPDIITTASLDRIDSSIGYISNNIQWVHKDIQRMKSNFNEKYFIEVCRNIFLHTSIIK